MRFDQLLNIEVAEFQRQTVKDYIFERKIQKLLIDREFYSVAEYIEVAT